MVQTDASSFKETLMQKNYMERDYDGQIRIVYMGAFLGRDEAEVYREEFFTEFGNDIEAGLVVMVQDDLVFINNHWVVRIMAQNAQLEMELELE